eukprot:3564941-Rhodomonas_salina.1
MSVSLGSTYRLGLLVTQLSYMAFLMSIEFTSPSRIAGVFCVSSVVASGAFVAYNLPVSATGAAITRSSFFTDETTTCGVQFHSSAFLTCSRHLMYLW